MTCSPREVAMIEDAMMTDQITVNAEWLAELQRENERLQAELAEAREALTNINALGPHHNHIGQVSDNAMRGLVIRMSEIAAVALTGQGGEQ